MVSTGSALFGTETTPRIGSGSTASPSQSASGTCPAGTRTAPGSMGPRDGSGQTPTADSSSTTFASIVSRKLIKCSSVKAVFKTVSFFSGPTTCGKPEQPPNSTLIANSFGVGARIEYSCDEGHLLVGPSKRSCLPTGFYSEFPPVCRCT